MSYVVTLGDVLETCKGFESESFDGCLCDPPYGLSFMGKRWDYDVPSVETWESVLAVLKPGAHLLAFAGTRTQHRMAVRIEDAGFEIRDMIAWVYGSGFPKSLDASKAIDKAAGLARQVTGSKLGLPGYHLSPHNGGEAFGKGISSSTVETRLRASQVTSAASAASAAFDGYGTALKPALEPITVARKPLVGTVAANVLAFGTGAINIDESRVGTDGGCAGAGAGAGAGARVFGDGLNGTFAPPVPGLGRWPANLIHDGSDEVLAGFPETNGSAPGSFQREKTSRGLKGGGFGQERAEMRDRTELKKPGYPGAGSAARFFYCAKASRSEREAGLREAGLREGRVKMNNGNDAEGDPVSDRFTKTARNHHPTVKPLALAEYLARLILPPKRDTPRRLLVPFSGSGSEIIGAMRAGWDEVVGIELSPEYAEIAEARIAHWIAGQQELAL